MSHYNLYFFLVTRNSIYTDALISTIITTPLSTFYSFCNNIKFEHNDLFDNLVDHKDHIKRIPSHIFNKYNSDHKYILRTTVKSHPEEYQQIMINMFKGILQNDLIYVCSIYKHDIEKFNEELFRDTDKLMEYSLTSNIPLEEIVIKQNEEIEHLKAQVKKYKEYKHIVVKKLELLSLEIEAIKKLHI